MSKSSFLRHADWDNISVPEVQLPGMSAFLITNSLSISNIPEKRFIHSHRFMELGFCVSGSGIYYIRDEIYPFGKGDIAIVYPGEYHDACQTTENGSVWRFLFADTTLLFADMPDKERLLRLSSAERCRGHLCSLQERSRIQPLLQRIFDMQEENRCLSRDHAYLTLLTAGILYETERFLPGLDIENAPQSVTNEMHQWIMPAVTFIMNHYTSRICMQDLCAQCYISEGHLRRVFTAVFGIPPMVFLQKVRIKHACAALDETDAPVMSIAEQCGYTTLSSFNQQFQKIMHMSPSQFRKRHQIK